MATSKQPSTQAALTCCTAQTTTLEHVCSRDTAEAIAQHLALTDLAALSAVSRAWRASLSSISQTVWHHAALAAVAASGKYQPLHPVHPAACCATFLRRQHATHASLASGTQTTRRLLSAEGAVSANLQLHATLLKGPKVSCS